MNLRTTTLLSGMLLSAGLAFAQTNNATTPMTPDTKPNNATPRSDDPTGVHSPQRGRKMENSSSSTADQTMGVDHMQTKKEADAAYTEAKRHCKTLARDERSACMKQARADHKHSKEMGKDGSMSGSR